jgi:hypothetical protein
VTVVERWRTFWFARIPSPLFSLLRIAIGATGLAQLLFVRDIRTFWSPAGLMAGTAHPAISAWLLAHELGVAAGLALFVAELVCLTAMTLGYRSRTAVVLVFIGARFEDWWNLLPSYGGSALWTNLVFCLIWADTGRFWSLDRRRDRSSDPEDAGQPIWPLRLMQFQLALMYFVSACWKLLAPQWRDGSALLHVLRDQSYTRFPGDWYGPLEPVLTLATYATVAWELCFPAMLWNRHTRRIALASGVMIHLLMWATLDVQLFSVIVVTGYLSFIDPHAFAEATKVARKDGFARLSA